MNDLDRWRRDPCTFVDDALRNPETGEPFVLYPAEQDFMRRAFTVGPDGRLPYPELVFSAPKKSGKTGFAAMCLLYCVVVLGGPYAEGYAIANDLEQSQSRVYQAAARMVRASPILADDAKVGMRTVEFPATGATIIALAQDYAGAAGGNPTITVADELWGFTSERSRRLWDEMIPPPTRKIATRLTVTYAGFEGESELLEELYKRGLNGTPVGADLYEIPGEMLMFWTHDPVAPWQTEAWLAQMRAQHRPNAYLRQIENRWVSTESTFVDMEWWDACTDPDARHAAVDRSLPVWVGVDASVKRDSTAIVACSFDAGEARLAWHRVFQPSPDDPLDFSAAVEDTLRDMAGRFDVREIRYDPYQMAASAQRLERDGLPMIEFPQSVPNLTAASTNLYELIKGRRLRVYPDDAVRLAVQRAVAKETTRGWRIAKEKASHKIDVVVALGMAAFGAVHGGQQAARPGFGIQQISIYG